MGLGRGGYRPRCLGQSWLGAGVAGTLWGGSGPGAMSPAHFQTLGQLQFMSWARPGRPGHLHQALTVSLIESDQLDSSASSPEAWRRLHLPKGGLSYSLVLRKSEGPLEFLPGGSCAQQSLVLSAGFISAFSWIPTLSMSHHFK